MPKAILQFYTKSYSLYGDPIEIDTEAIPRAGELINAKEFLKIEDSEVEYFFVLSVVYKLTKSGLIPHITARQWMKAFRHDELKRRGWLEPDSTEFLSYDEDDPAIQG